MQEEVIALKQPHTESAACLGLTRLKLLGADQQVLLAAKGGDGTVQGRLRSVRVGLAQLEVRAHDRDEHLHQFGMLQDTLWCATDTRENVDDPGVGQLMKRRVAIWQLRRAKRRSEDVHWFWLLISAQVACEFEADERSHAVTKEGERHVHKRLQCHLKRLYQWLKTCEGRFPHATLASRQKYRADLNLLGQFSGPETKDRCSPSCVRRAQLAPPAA